MVFDTIQNDLKLNAGTQPNEFVNVLGFNAPGDGGGGDFYWDALSTLPANDYNVIQPAPGAGRWLRISPGMEGDDVGSLRICFVQGVASYAEFVNMREAGFNCIMHYKYGAPAGNMTRRDLCNLAMAAGLRMIINLAPYNNTDVTNIINDIGDHPGVVGYYLYDEPDGSSVSIATQEIKIAHCRTLTDKPLFTSMTVENQLVPLVSKQFDVYLLSLYYIISNSFTSYGGGGDSVTYNYNKMGTQSALYRELYPGKTIIPVATTFAGGSVFGDAPELMDWQKKFFSYFGEHNSVAAFVWDTGGDVTESINTNSVFLDYAKTINEIAIRGVKGRSQTFVYSTAKPSNLNVNELPNKDLMDPGAETRIRYFSIINVGTGVNERQQTFAEQGIAVRDTGGIISYRCPDVKRIRLVGDYHNYADTTRATFQLLTSNADYYYYNATVNNVQVLATATNVANLTTIELWGYGDLKSFGIQFSPENSYVNYFKFLKNAYIAGF
jgi:hypothetical protein